MLSLRRNPWVVTVFLLVLAVLLSAITGQEAPSSGDVSSLQSDGAAAASSETPPVPSPSPPVSSRETPPVSSVEPAGTAEECVGVWVPYLTLATPEKTKEAFCAKFDGIAEEAARMGFNTLFVHVRPFGDALYPSDYYPWSHILTGTQGNDPGFDPLAYMIEKSHAEGLEFHAWINPLRISLGATPASFSPDNPYILWQGDAAKKDMFLRYDGGICYDPGYGEVRDHITAGVMEIVQNYDVDGIHFDDYFYPENQPEADAASYALYLENMGTETALSKAEWRKTNINALVAQVYAAVKAVKPGVVFGISPTGVVKNNEHLSADVAAWCAVPGYVDYICPQLYYSTEGGAVPFGEALEAWNALPRCEEVKLYIGLAVYKAGTDADNGAWLGKDDILAQEILLGRESGATGFVLYAWDQLHAQPAAAEVGNALSVLA